MQKIVVIAFAALLLGCLTGAQTPPPRFEVASIKPTDPASLRRAMLIGGPGPLQPSGEYRDGAVTARALVEFAYPETYNPTGFPMWAQMQRFAVDALPPSEATAPSTADVRLMMQTLLAERFHLKLHVETKQGPVYFLVVAQGGPSKVLVAAAASDRPAAPFILLQPRFGTVAVFAHAVTMPEFAAALHAFDRPVIDHTGLTGPYSITIPPARGAPLPADALRPGRDQVMRDMLKKLGLEVQPGVGPVSTTVIDHIDEPTPN